MPQEDNETLEILRIALDEGRAGLASQDLQISSIRQRTVWIGGLAGFVASFIGKEAVEKAPSIPSPCSLDAIALWVGFAALIALFLAVVNILRPKGNYQFHNSPKKMVAQFIDGPNATSLVPTYRALVEFSQENYDNNAHLISGLYFWFWIASGSLVVEFFAWLYVIA